MILQLLAIGLVSILGQVVLLREMQVACFGSELIYILAFGFWLPGLPPARSQADVFSFPPATVLAGYSVDVACSCRC